MKKFQLRSGDNIFLKIFSIFYQFLSLEFFYEGPVTSLGHDCISDSCTSLWSIVWRTMFGIKKV